MNWTNCCLVAMLAINLFDLANGGHIKNSDAIQRLCFSGQSSQQANTDTTEDCYLVKYNIKRYSYLWTIDNFSGSRHGTGQPLNSPIFPAAPNDQLKWSIALYPKGKSEQNRNNISVFLKLNECKLTRRDVLARYKLSILDQQGNHCNLKDSERPFKFVTNRGWGFVDFINRDNLLDTNRGLLAGDKLKIYCEIDALTEPMEYSQQTNESKRPTNELLSQLELLYDSQQFTDVTISVGDKQFEAHKVILAASSPVFRAMFGHNMRESQVNHLEVVDIHPDVFEEVLRFIYTGKSSLLGTKRPINDDADEQQEIDKQQLASGLLMASDKYQLDGLASICDQVLSKTISLDSAGELLMLADSYNRLQLKTKVIEFIRNNYRQLFQTNSWWATFKEAPTELIVELNKEIFN